MGYADSGNQLRLQNHVETHLTHRLIDWEIDTK